MVYPYIFGTKCKKLKKTKVPSLFVCHKRFLTKVEATTHAIKFSKFLYHNAQLTVNLTKYDNDVEGGGTWCMFFIDYISYF